MDNDEHDTTIREDETGEQPGTDLELAPATKTIVVNGRSHDVTADEIGRDELARLAFPGATPDRGGTLTIAYDHGPSEAPNGLVPAERATRVLHGQTFSVSLTDKS